MTVTRKMRGLTPSQTVGPYYKIGLDWPQANRLVAAHTSGPHIVVQGQISDGAGEVVPDALIEIWQADAAGHYHAGANAAFRGAGRCAVDADGRYVFETLKPGGVSDEFGQHAPHINVLLMARGLLVHLYTRIYFADEVLANASDPILERVPVARRETLIAERDGDHYSLDIKLQGDGETVFFDV